MLLLRFSASVAGILIRDINMPDDNFSRRRSTCTNNIRLKSKAFYVKLGSLIFSMLVAIITVWTQVGPV